MQDRLTSAVAAAAAAFDASGLAETQLTYATLQVDTHRAEANASAATDLHAVELFDGTAGWPLEVVDLPEPISLRVPPRRRPRAPRRCPAAAAPAAVGSFGRRNCSGHGECAAG